MAATTCSTHLAFSFRISLQRLNSIPKAVSFNLPSRTSSLTTLAMEHDKLGDFGARDPFPAEIEYQFGDKVLGPVDTEHKILIPNASALSLAHLQCTPISPLQPPMTEIDAKTLLLKVVGWRLISGEGGFKLQCLWKLRDFHCGVELINRIYKAVEATGHFPDLHVESNQVRAELWTASIGGLSMNDFIVAAKIDAVKSSDLVPRKRAWA